MYITILELLSTLKLRLSLTFVLDSFMILGTWRNCQSKNLINESLTIQRPCSLKPTWLLLVQFWLIVVSLWLMVGSLRQPNVQMVTGVKIVHVYKYSPVGKYF